MRRLLPLLLMAPLLVIGASGAAAQNPAMVQCSDGRWVAQGPCKPCPDGSFIASNRICVLAPDGHYVPGLPGSEEGFAPDGSYVPKRGSVLCPDGHWVTGKRCILAPDGTWIGR